jgi:hypothetical protein
MRVIPMEYVPAEESTMEPMIIFGVLLVVLCGYITCVDMLGDSRFFKRDLAIARQLARKCRAGLVGRHKLYINAACGKLSRDHGDVATHIHEKVGLFIRLHSPPPGHKS